MIAPSLQAPSAAARRALRRGPASARRWTQSWPEPAASGHVLADERLTAALRRRAAEIEAAFGAIEPVLREIAPLQFESDFVERARTRIRSALGIELAPSELRASWSVPLDVRSLHAHCVLETFCRLAGEPFDRSLARLSDGEDVATLVRRWGFHAIDVTPCADGRLSGLVDFILRIPPAVIAARTSHAGALFDVEETLRRWESVELRRWREARPNAASEPTRYLKIGVYHFSGTSPASEGCAAHGHDAARAAAAVLERLEQFAQAVEAAHCCGAGVAILLLGVDTDTDAIRVHVPDARGAIAPERYVAAAQLYEETRELSREAAKNAIREAVARCAGVDPADAASEGMRWFCAYLLKNNLGQIAAVRAQHGESYAERGHTERLFVAGDPVDDVQLRNLAFQAQTATVEEAAADLDIGVKLLRQRNEPLRLAVPILAHAAYEPRIPGARERAAGRALRLRAAILARYAGLAAQRLVHVHAAVGSGAGAPLALVEPHSSPTESTL